MKKNYIYLTILLIATVIVTILLANLYTKETTKTSYSYNNLNKITSNEFEEYMMEHTDAIIYIADKESLSNNKLEKKFIKKLEKLNLLENTIYIDKNEITTEFQKLLKDDYSYEYNEKSLPTIIVVSDAEIIQVSKIEKDVNIDTLIDYEVFRW